MTRVALWKQGDAALWNAVEAWLAGSPAAQELADGDRRRIVRLRVQDRDVIAKLFIPQPGLQRLIGACRRRLALSSASREWRALTFLRASGLNVPEPLARARLENGGELLVLSFIPSTSLDDALRSPAAERHRLLAAVGTQVARMHACGWIHRDLHSGNFLVDTQGQPVLLDFQRASKTPRRRARFRDLGALDFSLAQASLSTADRVRLRRAALGISGKADRLERAALRRVASAASARGRRHFKSRTRRCLRSGRLYERIDVAGRRGLRLRDVSAELIGQALAIHADVQSGEGERATLGTVLKRDHRSRVTAAVVGGRRVVIKQVVKPGLGRMLADSLRGSPARRAWVGGHGLLARGIRAATPLAFVEVRHLGIPVTSLLVLEDVRPAKPANELGCTSQQSASRVADALRRLAVVLHRNGVVHGDLQAPHIYLSERGDQLQSALIDLEGVRFPRRLSDRQRIQSLAELNASLPDELLPAEERRRSFQRYAQVLPFGKGEAAQSERLAAELEIVRRSLARQHLWKGEGCSLMADRVLTPSRR